MDGLLELLGAWLATGYAVYGFVFLFLPAVTFGYLPVLAAAAWIAMAHGRGHQPLARVPARVRRPARLAVEITFGLINPVLYLTVLAPTSPMLRNAGDWGLTAPAWVLLVVFWTVRLTGAALDPRAPAVRALVRALLGAALACVLLYAMRDGLAVLRGDWGRTSPIILAVGVLRICPLYLVPAVLLWDYLRAAPSATPDGTRTWHGLFVLPGRAARVAVWAVAAIAVLTVTSTAYRRSDAAVRGLVDSHKAHIERAASQYDISPRLLAAIVYVTHRDQLSPFRDAVERITGGAWASNLRGQFGLRPPDRVHDIGTDENPLLNRAIDVSLGLAQVKPRTAQTASVLATGTTPDDLPQPVRFWYRDVEPAGPQWARSRGQRRVLPSPLPVPAARHAVTDVLLDDESNLAMAALVLALYQQQWEAANPAWSLREHPHVLATLYQIGFARSVPHAHPQSNAFGRRVREVTEQVWIREMFPAPDPAPTSRMEQPRR